jgi:hypothetical protein
VLNAYAHARFLALEPAWKSYLAVQFSRVSTLKADLTQKQRGLKELEKSYLAVVEVGAGEYGIAALTRIGLAYADLAKNIRGSPDPRGLSEEERKLYRVELEKLAKPLDAKSSEVLEQGLAKAYELSLYGPWTQKAQEELSRSQPGLFPKARAQDFELSDLVAPGLLEERPQ